MNAGWEESQTRRDDLHSEPLFKDGLKFPYVAKHPSTFLNSIRSPSFLCRCVEGRVVSALRLEIYHDQNKLHGLSATAAQDNNAVETAKQRAERINSLYAVFIFQFVDRLWESKDGGDSDSSVDSAFHLPTSPDEGIPVSSGGYPCVYFATSTNILLVLRPQRLIRPTNYYTSEAAPPLDNRKRKTPNAAFHRAHATSSISSSDEYEKVSEGSREGNTAKRYRHSFTIGPDNSTAMNSDRRASPIQASASNSLPLRSNNGVRVKINQKVSITTH